MVFATFNLLFNTLLCHAIDLGCCLLIRVSRPMNYDRHFDPIVVHAPTLEEIRLFDLVRCEPHSECPDPTTPLILLYARMMCTKDTGPPGASDRN